jgi:hypothetical protein
MSRRKPKGAMACKTIRYIAGGHFNLSELKGKVDKARDERERERERERFSRLE